MSLFSLHLVMQSKKFGYHFLDYDFTVYTSFFESPKYFDEQISLPCAPAHPMHGSARGIYYAVLSWDKACSYSALVYLFPTPSALNIVLRNFLKSR